MDDQLIFTLGVGKGGYSFVTEQICMAYAVHVSARIFGKFVLKPWSSHANGIGYL